MAIKPDVADVIFSAFFARRERLRMGEGARAVRIVGSQYSAEAMALRAFAARSRVPHTWVDVEDEDDFDVMPRAWASAQRPPRGDHAHGGVAASDARRVRRASRAHLPSAAGIYLRPGRRRERSGGPLGCGLRGVGGALDGVARRGGDRRAGRQELAHRELRRVPQRRLRRRPRVARRDPGPAARRAANAPCEVAGLRAQDGFQVSC